MWGSFIGAHEDQRNPLTEHLPCDFAVAALERNSDIPSYSPNDDGDHQETKSHHQGNYEQDEEDTEQRESLVYDNH